MGGHSGGVIQSGSFGGVFQVVIGRLFKGSLGTVIGVGHLMGLWEVVIQRGRWIQVMLGRRLSASCVKTIQSKFKLRYIINESQSPPNPVADPGFPSRGHQPLNLGQKPIICKIFAENSIKMKEIGPRRGAHPMIMRGHR